MMAYTDRHFRRLARIISPHVFLYSEMVTAQEVLHNPHSFKLKHHLESNPVALQLGGSDPKLLAQAAKLGESLGYVEINLNVGCPSDRVQAGEMGACLIKNPKRVAECLALMQQQVRIPVTIKTRIGVDDADSYEYFYNFIQYIINNSLCNTFIVHARKAWLTGLSPKENREIPPLKYDYVYQLKKDFPSVGVIVNGGIKYIEEIKLHLDHVDGVMLGREIFSNPLLLNDIEILRENTFIKKDISLILQEYVNYASHEIQSGHSLRPLLKPLFNLYKNQVGAKAWKKSLNAVKTEREFLDLGFSWATH